MAGSLGVGIIGASGDRGWAKLAHVPAVQGLAGLHLAAVASGTQAKADAAAAAFGAHAGYANGADLIQDANVDIVTVAVKVPDHRELVLAALAAGKHVYCEWPLGRDLAESIELADAAQRAAVHTAIGLQARVNAAVVRAGQLLREGAIGRALTARVLSTTMAFGPEVEDAMLFAEQPENGVTLVTIQGAHTLDLTIALLGEYANISALTTTQYPVLAIGRAKQARERTTPDHLLVQARLRDGVALSAEVAGGRPPQETPFRLDIVGEGGTLTLEGGAPRGFQSGRLKLLLHGEPQAVDEGEIAGFSDEAANVAGLYVQFRNDIASRHATVPGFPEAVRLTRLVDAALFSAATGTRGQAGDWPRQA